MNKSSVFRSKNFVKLALIVAAFLVSKNYDIQDNLNSTLDYISNLGATGVSLFIALYILCCILFIPGSILTLGAGSVYGVVMGSIYVSIASTIGAVICFILGRSIFRDWISSKVKANPKFNSLDKAVEKQGWKIVLLARLSPAFPFNLLNYFFGLTKVSLKDYFLASWIGMMPGTVMYVYIGSLASSLAEIGTGTSQERTTYEWAFYSLGLAATIAITVYVTKLAKAALSEEIN